MRIDDELIRTAEQRLSRLFVELQDFILVSAWLGPNFDYDLPYHDLLAVPGLEPARCRRLRRRGLVAMLFACLGAIEEHWSMQLASDHAHCLARLAALSPVDLDEERLIAIVRAAFAIAESGDQMAERDQRWVHERFVRGALDTSDVPGCSRCDRIQSSKPPTGLLSKPSAGGAVQRCVACGLWYVRTASGYRALGSLTVRQSHAAEAMIGCRADPAAIEEELFELPAIAFNEALHATYARDRDFVALFIPCLVHAAAARLHHGTHDVLRGLVDGTPSYAGEILAAIRSLPEPLSESLSGLERRCRDRPVR